MPLEVQTKRRRGCGASTPLTLVSLLILAALLSLPTSIQAAGQDVADEIFYQFMPICWRDSDGDTYRFGDFGGMTASLDYLEALGVTAVWMNPIFPSPAYHGYQHGAADQLNPWFGDQTDLIDFLEQAHLRGIKVFVDFVAYGVSHDSPWFQDAYGNPGSPYDDWLAFTNGGNTEYQGYTFPTWNGDTVGFINWDLRSSGAVDLVTAWARLWLDPDDDGDFSDGLDGYRLDHVWQYYPYGPDGWGYNIDSFWAPWRDALRAVNPDVFVFAEQADWGSHGAELLVGMDAAFAKPLEFAARDALQWEYADALYGQMAATLAALQSAPADGNFLCTIGNHDVDRLASAIGDDFDKGKAAAAVLLAQPLPPIIYFGDEIGMRGVKHTEYSGDAADIPFREPFKWNAVAGPPMSNYYVLNGDAYDGSYSQDHDGRSVEEQLGVSGSLLEAYRELIAVRKANVALRRGDYTAVTASSDRIWAFLRYHEAQQILVAINLNGSQRSTQLDLSGFEIPGGATTPVDLIGGASLSPLTEQNRDAYPLTLPAYGYGLYVVELVPPPPPPSVADGLNIPADFGPLASLALQNNATGLGDNVSELNQLFFRTSGDSLFLGLPGNMALDATGLVVLLDTEPGGQNVLDLSNMSPPPGGPDLLTGLELDIGFEPDQLIFLNAYGGTIYVDQYRLLTGGGADKTYRGQGTVNSGNGLLFGGDNPHNMQIALDNSNTLGVTDSDASGAATATTGFELFLPFDDVGLTAGQDDMAMAAFLMRSDGEVSNQWLPGLGGGWGNLGVAPDLTAVPGDQYITAPLITGVGEPPDERGEGDPAGSEQFGLHLRKYNPSRSRVVFAIELPHAGPARLTVYDLRGRLVRSLWNGPAPAGEQTMTWDGRTDRGRRAPTGVYIGKLEFSGKVATRRVMLMR